MHTHHHAHEHHSPGMEGTGNIALAFFLNLFFSIVELVGGLFTNSMAILSDALHDAGDSFSLGLAWYFQRLSKRKPTTNYTYGFGRLTMLSALINSVVLLTGSTYILVESVKRVFNPATTDARGMLLLAVAGVLINGFAALRLRKAGNLNERVVSLHMLEDVLGWVAVLIGSLVMMVVDVPWLDPALSIGISIFILYNVVKNLRSAMRVFLQGKPDAVDDALVRKRLLELPGVVGLHDLHIWSMDADFLVLSVHLVIPGDQKNSEQQTLRQAAHILLKSLNIRHSTIEIESQSESCEWCETD